MKKKNDSGEIVVEASIVVSIVVIFISIMFYFGMILYQNTLSSVMANQTAKSISQVYSNTIKDPFTGYVDADKVYQDITYTNMKNDAHIDYLQQKANLYAKYRLKSSSILPAKTSSVEVEIVKKPNELLKSQIVVTIKDTYDVPLSGLFGVNNGLSFTVTGRADCVDILDYINGVDAVGDPAGSNLVYVPTVNSCIVSFVPDRNNANIMATTTVLKGKSIASSAQYSRCSMPTNPTKEMAKFMGWIDENGNSFTAVTEVNDNMIVYGKWNCTVTLDEQSGKVNPTSIEVELGNTVKLPEPTRTGYTFKGWFTEKNGVGTQYFSNSTVINGNVTLYAHWQCNHNYQLTSSTAASCVKKGTSTYKCSQCGDTYTEEGNFGAHQYGASTCTFSGNCVQRSKWSRTCSVCGHVDNYDGAFGNHDFCARCGKTHPLGDSAYKMAKHSGSKYVKTTAAECVVCIYCNSLWDGINSNPENSGWTIRNGQVVAKGMYCRQHLWTNGKYYSDSAFATRTNKYIH